MEVEFLGYSECCALLKLPLSQYSVPLQEDLDFIWRDWQRWSYTIATMNRKPDQEFPGEKCIGESIMVCYNNNLPLLQKSVSANITLSWKQCKIFQQSKHLCNNKTIGEGALKNRIGIDFSDLQRLEYCWFWTSLGA